VKALEPPRAVLDIAERLERAGFETWCVGGAVRDALLGRQSLDWDLATAAVPQEVQKLFRRTVPVGIEFGTVGVVDRQGVMHEVTTFRRDVDTDGRHAVVAFGASLDEDLARRDFTINAIAWSPTRRRLHDPFEGQRDLERRVLRAVGDPEQRMREDRLRALRAIRFASRFGFAIEDATWRAMVASAAHLGRLSPERVKQEIEKTMEQVPLAGNAFALWKECGAIDTLIPALGVTSDVALGSLNCLPAPREPGGTDRVMNRLAALFLELDGPGASRVAKDLRFSNQQVGWIASLAERWGAGGDGVREQMASGTPPTDSEVRRWAAQWGRTRLRAGLRIAAARWNAERALGRDAPAPERVRSVYRRAIRIAFRDPIELGDLAINGEDLRDAGIPAGPLLGKILQALLAWVIDDPRRNTRDELLRKALELHNKSR
jgi:tRNA nucleotidyltransferase (CCA-adding enzyme)